MDDSHVFVLHRLRSLHGDSKFFENKHAMRGSGSRIVSAARRLRGRRVRKECQLPIFWRAYA